MTKKEMQKIKDEIKRMIENSIEYKEGATGDFENAYESGMLRGLERVQSLIEDMEAIKAKAKEVA